MYRRGFLTAAPLLALPIAATPFQTGAAEVVLELFTSQGCSSCPPADALLGELVRMPGVVGLAWHVDYWNDVGWVDRYARRAWTERQKSYAERLGGEVFTPALVVNGTAMLVGSDRSAVRRAMQGTGNLPVTVALRRGESGLEAAISPVPPQATGLWVTYDPEQTTQIGAGENQGRRLIEYRVVRNAVALPDLRQPLALPSVPDNCGAALLVQDQHWQMLGAAELPPQRS